MAGRKEARDREAISPHTLAVSLHPRAADSHLRDVCGEGCVLTYPYSLQLFCAGLNSDHGTCSGTFRGVS